MSKTSIGMQLLEAVSEALDSKGHGEIARPKLDIAALRKELHLSQKEFAYIYHIKLETLRNWEQGKRFPDTTSLAYLTCISQNPKVIKKMLVNVV